VALEALGRGKDRPNFLQSCVRLAKRVHELYFNPQHEEFSEWDNTLGYGGKLAVENIPAYARIDSRLGCRVGESSEIVMAAGRLSKAARTSSLEFRGPTCSSASWTDLAIV
jgi:hypothetical protein